MPDLSDQFYLRLEPFTDFATVGDVERYETVPADWVILAADIVRSRDAIEAGRYKEVNLIGAAVISAVLNQVGRENVPFVFGGDGAMLLVPPSAVEAGKIALAGVQRLAAEETGLSLRTAAIPLTEIRSNGADVCLRKYELSPGNYLAMVIGGGLELADRILKDEDLCKPFLIDPAMAVEPDLEGLSCRWEPLPSERGKVLSLILRPSEGGGESLRSVAADIEHIVGFDPLGETDSANHVTRDRLRFRFPPRGLGLEIRMLSRTGNRFAYGAKAVFQSLATIWGFVTGLSIGPFRPARYLQEICRHTDHRKLDDSLRLVLDVSTEQLNALTDYLDEAFRARRLNYGIHVSDSALMTCFMTDIGASQHVHFIDGANGGLSAAASDFKQRKAATS
ncbi:DUF3095 domain-containing protein [Roseibium polysiphoniae]|uniref:DUF3095 domain-containing protein n=1 Tax=Roseibium polysiphoniae TaxID=2571221 RepID=A0A944GU73_9HYPH|nr:DUF3095 domain-containing protein [Roseibium polysiphoniae]MBS8261250.1 DUF3095 domain-containing protein [Roseibium polysiphoniae]